MIERFIPRIEEFLMTQFSIYETGYGFLALPDNQPRFDAPLRLEKGLEFDLPYGTVFQHRMLVILRDLPIRSHQEELLEFALVVEGDGITQVVGDPDARGDINYGNGLSTYQLFPNKPVITCDRRDRDLAFANNHGFKVRPGGATLLWVCKAVNRKYLRGNTFETPLNLWAKYHPGLEF
jgi:hypothetical protein